MAAYKAGQRRREADKVAVKRRLSASDAEPAEKRPTPVPSSCLLPRASPLAHTPPNPAPPCAHPRHRRTCPPNQARRETPEACVAGSAEAPRAPPADPLRRLPQVLREEKEAAAAVEPEVRVDGVELLGASLSCEHAHPMPTKRLPSSPARLLCRSPGPDPSGSSLGCPRPSLLWVMKLTLAHTTALAASHTPVSPTDTAGTHSHFTHAQAQPHQSTALLRMGKDHHLATQVASGSPLHFTGRAMSFTIKEGLIVKSS